MLFFMVIFKHNRECDKKMKVEAQRQEECKMEILHYCRTCNKWMNEKEFITEEAKVCRACQAKRLQEFIQLDSPNL